MKSFDIYTGFVGYKLMHYNTIVCEDINEALLFAYNIACEEYDMFCGDYGFRTISDIVNDENVSYDKAGEIFDEERELNIIYNATISD